MHHLKPRLKDLDSPLNHLATLVRRLLVVIVGLVRSLEKLRRLLTRGIIQKHLVCRYNALLCCQTGQLSALNWAYG